MPKALAKSWEAGSKLVLKKNCDVTQVSLAHIVSWQSVPDKMLLNQDEVQLIMTTNMIL